MRDATAKEPITVADVKPTPQQVHALIPVRPQFTQTSRPSEDEVQDIIDVVADSLDAETVAGIWPDQLVGKVRYVIALNVAAQVESSFFPEQGIGTDDPAGYLYRQYQAELLGLRALLAKPGVAIGSGGVGNAFAIDMTPRRARAWDAEPDRWYGNGA